MRRAKSIFISVLIGILLGAAGASYVLVRYGNWIGIQRLSSNDQIARETPVPVMSPSSPTLPPVEALRNQALQASQQAETQSQPQPQSQSQPLLDQQLLVPEQPPPAPEIFISDLHAEPAAPGIQSHPRVQPHPPDPSANVGIIEGVPAKTSINPPEMPESPQSMAQAVVELRHKDLGLPVEDLNRQDLRDSFNEARIGHIHQAIDILAPRNTPVLAVDDGKIARLWLSAYGGITIYQFDSSKKYEYYYAHLERYATGLKEGDHVKRGQVIGYVGTSGNAPKNTPHLHFAIFKLTDDNHWWEGTPVNPYLVFQK
ncbi:MAG TPA: M23 family metallopeptidase [Acidobacteriota bacterium]|nr:M23 family metallopeptidase [Acidobacteriota bacterium]